MHATQILTLLLALSGALNTAFAAGIIVRRAGVSTPQATRPPPVPPEPSWPSSSPQYPPTTNLTGPGQIVHSSYRASRDIKFWRPGRLD